jgi:REP element-mobilizing transposase RayT
MLIPMPRKPRLEYPGAIYHVMNRGDRREDIVLDDDDRQRFAETLAEACGTTGWQVHAWCLMRNHFHLVVETPQANLVAGMQWFLGTYTARFNRRHKLFGHLFSGRYKSLIVDGSGSGYLRTVCDYVHLNPARAKLLKTDQRLSAYAWSSYLAAFVQNDHKFGVGQPSAPNHWKCVYAGDSAKKTTIFNEGHYYIVPLDVEQSIDPISKAVVLSVSDIAGQSPSEINIPGAPAY